MEHRIRLTRKDVLSTVGHVSMFIFILSMPVLFVLAV